MQNNKTAGNSCSEGDYRTPVTFQRPGNGISYDLVYDVNKTVQRSTWENEQTTKGNKKNKAEI
jgi:hypothetical protein